MTLLVLLTGIGGTLAVGGMPGLSLNHLASACHEREWTVQACRAESCLGCPAGQGQSELAMGAHEMSA